MAQVFISLGSNVEREKYVVKGLDDLAQAFGQLEVSSLYACEAVGFDGPEFYNLVVGAHTSMSLDKVAKVLRDIEYANGRSPNAVKFSPRTLDLDLLLYDDCIADSPAQIPRDEILKNAFVLCPLAEIAPRLRHPIAQQSYASLWQAYDQASQHIQQLPLPWQQPVLINQ
ncbi:2-amino-4-hydroxy-6-hydroxymethyldihydropteridine diphosphokinase [Thalassotalea euphylliae]|uniref:2-amino-4-hydroxy-6-hydroxymethyldihydropteridine diphosphokinase n=1 Tax=Thalassotalea euphylliae TaxID=1655234 RepID=A0A3E0UJW1_9GAMM|nr:2-amino-4-hydroxy-6-hydroxymethyldihydropteridine diphosphokinase [Thalassotalea euphylliae]REL36515.1 2-amino-4-hydroxy-6-hydroxymethyldihydropteridine diphosphokinase [Thalassotalea euphylliae]